ncbi:MAG: methionine--tRNA ligase [Planctomycetes bacterium]|nr:methionine--tRNA ligase [Planctomycetota bacterium]
MPDKYIVTSALPYVNGVKHLGNLIGSLLPADIHARFLRFQGHDVLAVCGTDEHGTPCELAALDEGLPVAEYARKYYEKQKDIYERFGLSFDYFGRTSSPQNHQMTQRLFGKLREHDLISEHTTKHLYCLDDKRFLPDRFVIGACPHCGYERARGDQCESCTTLLNPEDLINPRSSISGSERIEIRESKHLFLELPKMAGRLEEWLKTKEHWPKTTISIAWKWLNEGLRARCITRDLEWGIKVPMEGYEDKVFYVWFDAPIGYIGISMEWAAAQGDESAWERYWKDPDTKLVQFMAKDNIPFHTITWPAVMMGADDGFVLAHMIKGFQWLNYEGGKFSTSQNRGVFTDDALELFPPDYWRYYLVKIAPEKGDTDFTWQGFMEGVNKDLADVLGNFVHRTLTFAKKYFDGTVPKIESLSQRDQDVRAFVTKTRKGVSKRLGECRIQLALRELRDLWDECNRYFDDKQPWHTRKEEGPVTGNTISTCIHLVRSVAILSAPFIPFTATEIFRQLGIEEDVHSLRWDQVEDWDCLTGRPICDKPTPLFTKIEQETVDDLAKRYAGGGEPE